MSQQIFNEGTKARGLLLAGRMLMQSVAQTLSGNITLDINAEPIQILDPGGSGRNVDLPDPANAPDGTGDHHVFFICNDADAAEALTVRDQNGNTVITANQGQVGFCVANGGTWKGWDLG